jgi:hypothetical protein
LPTVSVGRSTEQRLVAEEIPEQQEFPEVSFDRKGESAEVLDLERFSELSDDR